MVQVCKVDRSMFPQVYSLLLEFGNERLTEEDWRRFFDYPWETDEDYCGYALLDGATVVGFIGMIFSQRVIDGRSERFCNLANWIVKEEYRGKSLALLLPPLKLADYTLTDFTPSPQVCAISQRLGFRQLDARLKVLLPVPWLRFGAGQRAGLRIITAIDEIEGLLRPPERRILQDHRDTSCYHLVAHDGQEFCYVIFCVVQTTYGLRYSCIHYIGNKEFYARHSNQIRTAIGRQSRSPIGVVGARHVAGLALPWSFDLPVTGAALFKSERLQPEQIDNLYSELILANVSVLPSIRSLFAPLKRLLRRETVAGLRPPWPMQR